MSIESVKLDCPFCGQQPFTDWQYAWGGAIVGSVRCMDIDCISPTARALVPPPHNSDSDSAVRAVNMAIEKWNRRP